MGRSLSILGSRVVCRYTCECVCAHVSVCVHMHLCVCGGVSVCVSMGGMFSEVRGHHLASSSSGLHFFFFWDSLSQNLNSTDLTRLEGSFGLLLLSFGIRGMPPHALSCFVCFVWVIRTELGSSHWHSKRLFLTESYLQPRNLSLKE